MQDDIDDILNETLGRERVTQKQDNVDAADVRVWRDGASVEINHTSAGKFSFTVKVNEQNVDKAAAEANRITQELLKRYGNATPQD